MIYINCELPEQFLVLRASPPPHVTSQRCHDDHSSQNPSTIIVGN